MNLKEKLKNLTNYFLKISSFLVILASSSALLHGSEKQRVALKKSLINLINTKKTNLVNIVTLDREDIIYTIEQFPSIHTKIDDIKSDLTSIRTDIVKTKKLITESKKELTIQANNEHLQSLKEQKSFYKKEIEEYQYAKTNLTSLAEALYLTATTEEDVKKNKELYRKIILLIHSDKTLHTSNDELIKNITPLLKDNKINYSLESMVKEIEAKLIDEQEKPSIVEQVAMIACSEAAWMIGYKAAALLMPAKKKCAPQKRDQFIAIDKAVADKIEQTSLFFQKN